MKQLRDEAKGKKPVAKADPSVKIDPTMDSDDAFERRYSA